MKPLAGAADVDAGNNWFFYALILPFFSLFLPYPYPSCTSAVRPHNASARPVLSINRKPEIPRRVGHDAPNNE